MKNLYQESFGNYTNENLKKNGLDMNELFDKMSVKFKDLSRDLLILFRIFANKLNKTVPGQFQINYAKNYYIYTYIGEPLETINIIQNGDNFESIDDTGKCLTFFSHVQDKWKTFIDQIKIIHIRIMKSNILKELPYVRFYFNSFAKSHT